MTKSQMKGELSRPVRQTVTLTKEEGARIDAARGLVAFTVWARAALLDACGPEKAKAVKRSATKPGDVHDSPVTLEKGDEGL